MKSHSSLPLRFGLFLVSWLMVWACFRFLLPLFTPFVLAFLTFLLLRPVFRFLRRRVSWPDWCIYTLVLILFFAAMGLVLWFLGSQLIHQCFLLQKKFPGYLESMADRCQYLAVRICGHADRLGGFASGQSFRRLQQFTDHVFCPEDLRAWISESGGSHHRDPGRPVRSGSVFHRKSLFPDPRDPAGTV